MCTSGACRGSSEKQGNHQSTSKQARTSGVGWGHHGLLSLLVRHRHGSAHGCMAIGHTPSSSPRWWLLCREARHGAWWSYGVVVVGVHARQGLHACRVWVMHAVAWMWLLWHVHVVLLLRCCCLLLLHVVVVVHVVLLLWVGVMGLLHVTLLLCVHALRIRLLHELVVVALLPLPVVVHASCVPTVLLLLLLVL